MSSQVLVPAAAHTRIADALDDLSPAVQPLLWSPDGVVDTDGNPVADVAPEVAWVAIDLLFSGDFLQLGSAELSRSLREAVVAQGSQGIQRIGWMPWRVR